MFKAKAKKRQYRRKDSDEEKSDDDDVGSEEKRLCHALEDIRDLQKLRKRTAGVSAEELTLGTEAVKKKNDKNEADPLKLKTGGCIKLSMIKSSDFMYCFRKNVDVEDNIKRAFSKESNLRDEDEEMRRYVEEQMAKKKGLKPEDYSAQTAQQSAEDALFALPEQLKKYQSKKNEEMLSNQMLCGIPEVNLGLEAKIKNIEETESTKLRLLKDAVEKRKNLEEALTFRQDIIKDLAKDYVRHNRFDIDATTRFGKMKEDSPEPIERPPTEAQAPVVGDDTPSWHGRRKATDNIDRPSTGMNRKPTDKQYYDKFKKRYTQDKK